VVQREYGQLYEAEKAARANAYNSHENPQTHYPDGAVSVTGQARKINRETGYEIGGYAVHPELDSVAWVGTDLLEDVKAKHGTQMHTQATQIAALVQYVPFFSSAILSH
jgi:hypothetical protein